MVAHIAISMCHIDPYALRRQDAYMILFIQLRQARRMLRLRFKTSQNPIQNIRWGLMHVGYFAGFSLIVFLLNQYDVMRITYPIIKAVLIFGLFINFLYFCGYMLIACVKYFWNLHANRKNQCCECAQPNPSIKRDALRRPLCQTLTLQNKSFFNEI